MVLVRIIIAGLFPRFPVINHFMRENFEKKHHIKSGFRFNSTSNSIYTSNSLS